MASAKCVGANWIFGVVATMVAMAALLTTCDATELDYEPKIPGGATVKPSIPAPTSGGPPATSGPASASAEKPPVIGTSGRMSPRIRHQTRAGAQRAPGSLPSHTAVSVACIMVLIAYYW